MPMNFHLMHHWLVICSKHIINKNVVVFTPQLVGEARQLGCPKIVLGHMHYIYIYICMYAPQCLSTRCIGGT